MPPLRRCPRVSSRPHRHRASTICSGWAYIILPQSIPVMLPPMVNQVVNLFKNTSCLYIVGGADLISVTYSFVTGENTGGAYAPAYLVSGLLFFVICYPLSKTASVWEIHLKKRDQRVTFQRTEGTVTDNE